MRRSEEPRWSASHHVPAPGITPFSPRGPLCSACSLARSSFVISCPWHPTLSRPVGWAGLGLGKDGGGGRWWWAPRRETRSRVPHTPASAEARAGSRGGRGCALPCCSLPTQVLHRRSPGGTEGPRAEAAFKYRPVATASLVARGDSQLGSRLFSWRRSGIPGGTRCPVKVPSRLVTQVLKEGKRVLVWGGAQV